eukprot:201897-Amphidinium_carterae.1
MKIATVADINFVMTASCGMPDVDHVVVTVLLLLVLLGDDVLDSGKHVWSGQDIRKETTTT